MIGDSTVIGGSMSALRIDFITSGITVISYGAVVKDGAMIIREFSTMKLDLLIEVTGDFTVTIGATVAASNCFFTCGNIVATDGAVMADLATSIWVNTAVTTLIEVLWILRCSRFTNVEDVMLARNLIVWTLVMKNPYRDTVNKFCINMVVY